MRDGALRLTECTIIAATTIAGLGMAAAATAQARFDVLGGDVVQGLNGMTVYTIRDNRMAQCFTLFVTDGERGATPLPLAIPPPEPTPEQLAKIDTAQTLRDARAERDRQILALRSRTTFWVNDYAFDQMRIDQDYEQAVSEVLPGLYPSMAAAPGWPTTSRLEMDAMVSRAITEGEAVAVSLSRAPLEDRLRAFLERADAARAPRVAVSGPSPCGQNHGRQ
jgi:hypothetical protein